MKWEGESGQGSLLGSGKCGLELPQVGGRSQTLGIPCSETALTSKLLSKGKDAPLWVFKKKLMEELILLPCWKEKAVVQEPVQGCESQVEGDDLPWTGV